MLIDADKKAKEMFERGVEPGGWTDPERIETTQRDINKNKGLFEKDVSMKEAKTILDAYDSNISGWEEEQKRKEYDELRNQMVLEETYRLEAERTRIYCFDKLIHSEHIVAKAREKVEKYKEECRNFIFENYVLPSEVQEKIENVKKHLYILLKYGDLMTRIGVIKDESKIYADNVIINQEYCRKVYRGELNKLHSLCQENDQHVVEEYICSKNLGDSVDAEKINKIHLSAEECAVQQIFLRNPERGGYGKKEWKEDKELYEATHGAILDIEDDEIHILAFNECISGYSYEEIKKKLGPLDMIEKNCEYEYSTIELKELGLYPKLFQTLEVGKAQENQYIRDDREVKIIGTILGVVIVIAIILLGLLVLGTILAILMGAVHGDTIEETWQRIVSALYNL